MTHPPDAATPNTPSATRSQAQSREPPATHEARNGDGAPRVQDEHRQAFQLSDALARRTARPYMLRDTDPLYRPLQIYTLDAGESRSVGAQAVLNVPWEPLKPGPVGQLFAIDGTDQQKGVRYQAVDLDEHRLLLQQGITPTPADARFHQQMTYAVCSTVYHTFRKALGRDPSWGFAPRPETRQHDNEQKTAATPRRPAYTVAGNRLLVLPYAMEERNAYYDKSTGSLRFGYYTASNRVAGTNLPGGIVFTSLSHDIVAHEMTHALLDGLRAHFTIPTGPDVLAFHEALADLIAVFQHFSYPQVVQEAIRSSQGDLRGAKLLIEIGRQFGHTTGDRTIASPLRTAFDVRNAAGEPRRYDATLETHELGSILVEAVFAAFIALFDRKTESYRLLATNGTGVLPPGQIPVGLSNVLAEEASKLASQFLTICIRAVDYCPPVDIEFGEYLRALITADHDVVRDDRWHYRELLVEAFKARDIYPRGVSFLVEDALLWKGPMYPLPAIPELSFAKLRFRGDPGRAAGRRELRRQAAALGAMATRPEHLAAFGLCPVGEHRDNTADRPCVESVRTSRRIGPDGQVVFDLVAEITQRRVVRDENGSFAFYGGATVILDPAGQVRLVISKSIFNKARLERQQEYLNGTGAKYWTESGGDRTPLACPFRMTHLSKV